MIELQKHTDETKRGFNPIDIEYLAWNVENTIAI